MAWMTGAGWFGKDKAQQEAYEAHKGFWHKVWHVVSFKWARKAK
jgi:hypothetical protein